MPDKFRFELVSPERLLLSQEVEGVVVPGDDGQFTVLAHHAPLMATAYCGVLMVMGEGVEHPRYFIRGAFAEVTPDGLTVLAEEAVPVNRIDMADIEQRIRDLEEDVKDAKDDDAMLRAADKLQRMREVHQAMAA